MLMILAVFGSDSLTGEGVPLIVNTFFLSCTFSFGISISFLSFYFSQFTYKDYYTSEFFLRDLRIFT